MVAVLVRDEDGVEVADVVEVRHGARVDEQPRVVGLDEQAGMSQVGELHSDSSYGRSVVLSPARGTWMVCGGVFREGRLWDILSL